MIANRFIVMNFYLTNVLRPDRPFLFAAEKEAKAAKGVPPLESPLPRAAGEGARKKRALQIASSLGADLEADSGPQ